MSTPPLIVLDSVRFSYLHGTPFARSVLNGVDLRIAAGESLALMGPTGCGKTTLTQHLNGLLKPVSGCVRVDGHDLAARNTDLVAIRRKVGLLFQFPEHQLFEDTLARDVGYGPRNLGCPQSEVERRTREALDCVGLPWEDFRERNPYSLSGGEMRRAALAGVLAMEPRILVLDEPTAGLDARGRSHLLSILRGLHRERGVTLLLVSHDVEFTAELAERLVVMEEGRVVADGPLADVLGGEGRPRENGGSCPPASLQRPLGLEVARLLREQGLPVGHSVADMHTLAQEVLTIAMKQEASGNP